MPDLVVLHVSKPSGRAYCRMCKQIIQPKDKAIQIIQYYAKVRGYYHVSCFKNFLDNPPVKQEESCT